MAETWSKKQQSARKHLSGKFQDQEFPAKATYAPIVKHFLDHSFWFFSHIFRKTANFGLLFAMIVLCNSVDRYWIFKQKSYNVMM